jgi:hypothetical protein
MIGTLQNIDKQCKAQTGLWNVCPFYLYLDVDKNEYFCGGCGFTQDECHCPVFRVSYA